MTRLVAWVRALAGTRRRVVGSWPLPSMQLAIRPLRRPPPPAITRVAVHHHDHHRHEHVHRHLTMIGATRAAAPAAEAAPSAVESIVSMVTTFRPVARRADMAARPDLARAAIARRPEPAVGPAGAAPGSRVAGAAPVALAAVRQAVAQLAGAHRRVDNFVSPPLRAAAVAAPNDEEPAAPVVRARPLPATVPVPHRAMVRRPSAVAPRVDAVAPTAVAGREIVAPRGPAAAAADVDLESLTDRVVAQIDRRIVAHRERLGQI
jgi:hypothetical protein